MMIKKKRQEETGKNLHNLKHIKRIQQLEMDICDLEFIRAEYPDNSKEISEDRDLSNDMIIKQQLEYFKLTGKYYVLPG